MAAVGSRRRLDPQFQRYTPAQRAAAALAFASMPEPFVTRGFTGRRGVAGPKDRIPPGQHLVTDFPVLSAGPTPRLDLAKWQLEISGLVRRPAKWSWQEFTALPADDFVKDISCVTTWTKLDTKWHGISLDTLFANVELD